MRTCLLLAAILLSAASLVSAQSLQYHLVPGEVPKDTGCDPTSPARICLSASGTDHCFIPKKSTDGFIFGMEPEARSLGDFNREELILFSAMFSGCGSGTLRDYSLLVVRDGEFVNLLPHVRLTNQSEIVIWKRPPISIYPILITADFIWDFDRNETHFSSHYYEIDVYLYDPSSREYKHKLSYKTAHKYPGLDDGDEINVIKPETQVILKRLQPN